VNTSDLLFGQTPGSSHLVFGGAGSEMRPLAEVAVFMTLPSLSAEWFAIPDTVASPRISLPALQYAGQADYASRAARPMTGQTLTLWQRGWVTGISGRYEHQSALVRLLGVQDRWRAAKPQISPVRSKRPGTLQHDRQSSSAVFGNARSFGRFTAAKYADAMRLRQSGRLLYSNADPRIRIARAMPHQETLRDRRRGVLIAHAEHLGHAGRTLGNRIWSAQCLQQAWNCWQQNGRAPLPGRRTIPAVVPVSPCYTPDAQIRFAAMAANDSLLLFLCTDGDTPPPPAETRAVPIRKAYYVINSITLRRLSDGTEIPTLSLTLSLDAGSWTWGFDAVLPGVAMGVLSMVGGTQTLEANINGTVFRLLAESISRDRAFNESVIRLSGRGHHALLASPYAPVMSFGNNADRSAHQLMDDVLTVNGVSLGWAIDWQLTDWIVPAGIFNHQGTWIEALSTIAASAGGYLLPHPSLMMFQVKHRYGIAPWNWNARVPDIVLPADAISRESIRFMEKPAYNRVFVSGQETGVLGQVTRMGTAGDILAPMVVDPLITDVQAARQRGLAVLGDTGAQIEVNLKLPVLDEIGIVEPGLYVEYQEGDATRFGIVRSTRIEAGLPEVWQTLSVASHA
jgi:hypothetical protein